MPKIAFFTLGCKVNQYETVALEEHFSEEGFEIVPFDDFADVYIINSCTVTAVGDKKSRAMMRRAKKLNPNAIVALTGCFPQAFPDEASALTEVDIITGNKNRQALINAVKESLLTKRRIVNIESFSPKDPFEPMSVKNFPDRTRAFLKIEDGCDRYCSYCIIPFARGPVRSKPLKDVLEDAKILYQNGYREIVLTGINLSSYGKDISLSFSDAVAEICRSLPDVRIRLGSLEPDLISQKDIDTLAALDNFCPQFHLSLQSGCDDTLKRMRRRYDSAMYADLVKRIRTAFPDASVTTDVMTGFPGESQEEFQKSLDFVRSVGFLKVHIFPYSKRKGSKAADMPGQLTLAEKKRRCDIMNGIAEASRKEFLLSQIGKSVSVLFESAFKDGICEGYSMNYTPVQVASATSLAGQLLNVRITSLHGDCCFGELIL